RPQADQTVGARAPAQGQGPGGGGGIAGAAKKAEGLVRRGGRGRLTVLEERRRLLGLYGEAVAAGARRDKAAEELGLPARTLRRWRDDGGVRPDGRPEAERPTPGNRLSEAERETIIQVCNQGAYASLPPSQIVPRLADQGEYLASE